MKLRAFVAMAGIATVAMMGTGVAGASGHATEYFTAVQTSESGTQTVVANGPIAATGYDVQLGRHRDQFVFPEGTLLIRHEELTSSQSFDSATCTFIGSETGTYVIAKGSGAYTHVTGSGRYKVSFKGTGCDEHAPPTSFVVVIEAHGPIAL